MTFIFMGPAQKFGHWLLSLFPCIIFLKIWKSLLTVSLSKNTDRISQIHYFFLRNGYYLESADKLKLKKIEITLISTFWKITVAVRKSTIVVKFWP